MLIGVPGGTGQLISRLTDDQIDVAMYVGSLFRPDESHLDHLSALTDALISGIAKGSKAYKLVGSYVTSPLNWYALRILRMRLTNPHYPAGPSSRENLRPSTPSRI